MNLSELQGLWQRSMIAWPDGTRDTKSDVRWLQGPCAFIDLRQPASLPQSFGAHCRAELSMEDCAWLAKQAGFAGHCKFDGSYFEWIHAIDLQPTAQYSDAGSLQWEGDVLIERGRDVGYIEHWHRDTGRPPLPVGALALCEENNGTKGALLRVGPVFMFARERSLVPPAQKTLGECVAGARSLEHAQQLVDCEISFGNVSPSGFCITQSSLPYRRGDVLKQRLTNDTVITMDRAPNGDPIARHWRITEVEGERAALA